MDIQKTKVNWTSISFFSERKKVEEAIDAQFAVGDPELLRFLMAGYQARPGQDQSTALLLEFIFVLKSLEHHARFGGLSEPESRRVFDTGERILKAAGIDYSRSNLSFLYRMLYHAKSAIAAKNGRHDEAAWITEAAEHLCYRPDVDQRIEQEWLRAERLLRLGQSNAARDIVSGLIGSVKDLSLKKLTLLLARCEWLTGDSPGAIVRLETSGNEEDLWLARLLRAVQLQDYRPFYNDVRKMNDAPQELIFSSLWLFAPVAMSVRTMALKSASLRKKYNALTLKQNDASSLMEALSAVEDGYDNAIPLISRLNRIGDIFSQRKNFPLLEHELLFLAVAARHAMRYSQLTLADMLIGEYRSASAMMVPMGHDILGVISDLTQAETFRAPEIQTNNARKQSRGKIVRTARIAALVGRGMGMWTTARLRGLVAGESARRQIYERSQQQFGEHALAVMSDLKGGFMKLGQIIAASQDVPGNIRTPMTALHNHAGLTDPAESRRVIEKELGGPIGQFFQSWDDQPFAVGSIGQVFRARTIDGYDVAVKVQHPGIEEVVRNDCQSVMWVKPVLKHFLPQADHENILKEVATRILEETDYNIELKNQQLVGSFFRGDPDIVIPQVYPQYSTKKVLTSEYIGGQEFAEYVESADQNQRNRAAEIIMRMFCSSLFQHCTFNADPHPGNYIFLPDNRIAFIDFGCTKTFSQELVRATFEASATVLEGDVARNRQAWIDLGYIPNPDSFDFDQIYHVFRQMYAPAVSDQTLTFDHKILAQISSAQLETPVGKLITPPPESAMLVRFTWGLLTVLAQLEPQLNFYRLSHQAIASFRQEKGAA